MSEDWIYYPCQMGDYRATILFDFGIRETVNDTAPGHFLQVRLSFKQPSDDGFYEKEEFEALSQLDDAFKVFIADHESLYVGRVTTKGARYFFVYTSEGSENEWAPRLEEFGRQHGYELQFIVEEDDQHERYWKELYPTPDDWQVIEDVRVLEVLQEEGDDPDTVRPIDHWAYFSSESVAAEFGVWASAQGYEVSAIEPRENEGYCVRFQHAGNVRLVDITSHTLAALRKARELGGEYDGWETPVCKPGKS